MKKILFALVIALALVSCADSKEINGVEYRPYGFFNESSAKNDSIKYEISTAACISGVFFCETLIVPVYTFGFNLWQPIGTKSEFNKNNLKGRVE